MFIYNCTECYIRINTTEAMNVYLKGQCHEMFDFFPESVSPKLLNILGPFRIFSKILGDYRAQDAPPLSLTPVGNRKILQSDKF
jgi:hypothetical protein